MPGVVVPSPWPAVASPSPPPAYHYRHHQHHHEHAAPSHYPTPSDVVAAAAFTATAGHSAGHAGAESLAQAAVILVLDVVIICSNVLIIATLATGSGEASSSSSSSVPLARWSHCSKNALPPRKRDRKRRRTGNRRPIKGAKKRGTRWGAEFFPFTAERESGGRGKKCASAPIGVDARTRTGASGMLMRRNDLLTAVFCLGGSIWRAPGETASKNREQQSGGLCCARRHAGRADYAAPTRGRLLRAPAEDERRRGEKYRSPGASDQSRGRVLPAPEFSVRDRAGLRCPRE